MTLNSTLINNWFKKTLVLNIWTDTNFILFFYLKINYIFSLFFIFYIILELYIPSFSKKKKRIIYSVASLTMVIGIFATSSSKRPIYKARDLKLSLSCDLISKRVKTILFFESGERESWTDFHRQSRGIKRKGIRILSFSKWNGECPVKG